MICGSWVSVLYSLLIITVLISSFDVGLFENWRSHDALLFVSWLFEQCVVFPILLS